MTDPEALPFSPDEIEGSIPERFAKVAATRQAALAIATGSQRLTYGELDLRSDRLAAAITRRAPDREMPVAVLLDDPVSMITAMLATWKAGRLCVPLDSARPPARLEVILRDAEPGLIVTDGRGSAALSNISGTGARPLRVDELDLREVADAPRPPVTADQLACLLYTSGATGQPKGLVRSHRHMLHRAHCSVTSLAIRPADRVSALHSPSFGAGLGDVMAALLSGATLLPFDPRTAGLGALASWIDRERVSVLCAVVTTFRHLLAEIGPDRRFPSVRVVRLGSEPLFRHDVERFREHFGPHCLLVAGYGVSEASDIVEYRMSHDTPLPAARVPAGYPHAGVEILVLDEDGRAVRDGEAGEVAVRSRYLSEGYWRRADLTHATFQSDPADSRSRIYRTGDVGRLLPDGCLELLGRRDHQVKVRGYEVHPGEIEAALTEHAAVREAVVTAWVAPDGDTHLAAYIVPRTPAGAHASTLREFLRARLPVYMVPSAFIRLDTLPLGPNGTVDREALPPPPRPTAARAVDFVSPRSPLEHQVAGIWEDLFGVRPIGARDDFFDLGGDLLLAAALVAAIEETCGRVLPPAVLLEAPTVATLAALLIREEDTFDDPLTALRDSGSRPPMIFVHNDHGRGLYTHALARALDPDRPFYAVHLHGLARRELPTTVEGIAADRLLAVRAACPHGPYVLGGHGEGGLVALEMARQLRAEGERVESVLLVDTRAPSLVLRTLHRAAEGLARLRRLPPDERAEFFWHMVRVSETLASHTRYYAHRAQTLRRMDLDGRAEFVGRQLARAVHGFAQLRGRSRRRRRAPAAIAEPTRAYRRAIRHYLPAPYGGPVVLFLAEEFPAYRPDLGWSRLLPQLEVVIIPGDHHSCVTRHVGVFGAQVEEVLRRIEGHA
jgi:amino acid adenylation domain-containing protein